MAGQLSRCLELTPEDLGGLPRDTETVIAEDQSIILVVEQLRLVVLLIYERVPLVVGD